MEILLMVLVLLLLIGASNVIQRFVPFIPVPLIQIALGIVAAYMPSLHHVPLNPELFMVLFIAPLLFNDGKITPRDELWKLRTYILLLALGLVFATVLLAGPFIHWLIPTIPLSAAFALAAILSPTDAVAVGSIAGRIKLPGNILRLLEGESLMNDASGLVAFNFAIAATVTGYFSLSEAIGSFFVIAIGGLVIGALLGFAVIWLRLLLRRLGMEDVTLHMLIIILTPFLIYIAAEECHVSGILAVVAAGVVHAIERDRVESASVRLRIVSDSTWSVILFSLNGLVFLLLGLEIPGVVAKIWEDPAYQNGQVIGYIFLITAVLMILRFLVVLARDRQLRSSVITALSGVRGALTLAAAFSIPMVLDNGSAFPERNLILFICAGVILLTLISASTFLPLLVRKSEETGDHPENRAETERTARIAVLDSGLRTVREEMNEENKQEGVELVGEYTRRMQQAKFEGTTDIGQAWRAMVNIRLEALKAEREVGERWLYEERITPQLAAYFRASLNRIELLLTNRVKFKLLLLLAWSTVRKWLKGRNRIPSLITPSDPEWDSYKELKLEAIQSAITRLKQMENEENRDAVLTVLADYRSMALQYQNNKRRSGTRRNMSFQRKELELKAIQAERNAIQMLYEQGDIDRHFAGKLRMDVNYREASLFESQEGH
ncbi:sodium, potassium, lithium and rubidium/H(+) antiporter [Brevibacillus reuszeri]|uniref:Sodium, potassium, lithium and rubidium/H(+) antiporter n=1 Tax=Brevibacillus reuszeri TaxID=54915 RepID=A0A0K9YPQ6_9BACL|nr:Na+/H+ antiporter [Brevibacillus reuszeri]KNB70637.1 sodium:proton antiporter [Brevibacillus reuszeri]MED1861373.1 Na+/H+ antiporter [Brevibacillus reuszeri]GED69914.1 sodium, potassium, lithium and rubidium/H(+) antiporter [Brevibacillus reuszeri]